MMNNVAPCSHSNQGNTVLNKTFQHDWKGIRNPTTSLEIRHEKAKQHT